MLPKMFGGQNRMANRHWQAGGCTVVPPKMALLIEALIANVWFRSIAVATGAPPGFESVNAPVDEVNA